jgi:hypothetical protein
VNAPVLRYDIATDEMKEVTQADWNRLEEQARSFAMRHSIAARLRNASPAQLHEIMNLCRKLQLKGDGKTP